MNGTEIVEILSWVKGLRLRKKEGNSGFMRELRNIRLSWKTFNEDNSKYQIIRYIVIQISILINIIITFIKTFHQFLEC